LKEKTQSDLASWERIERLIQDGAQESSYLDFKEEPYAHPNKSPEKKKKDKLELRRDMTAFSNAAGGAIVLGIRENDMGQAVQIVPVENLRASESFVTEVLSHEVSPPFEGDLDVRILRDPKDSTRAVIVIEVSQARPGSPRAVINDDLVEFWIREGKSKRPMTYAQIEQDFHGDHAAEENRRIDAQAKSAVLRIQHRLERSKISWPEIRALLEELEEYAVEYPYGFTVKEAVLYAAHTPFDFARVGVPYDVAEHGFELIRKILPMHSLVSKTRPLATQEVALLQYAASKAVDLIYEATRYLHDIILINVGAKLLHNILRFAHLNDLQDLKHKVLTGFEERIAWVERDKVKGGARLLQFYKNDALTLPDDDLCEFPKELRWLIWHSPTKLPEDYSQQEK
jgi:hypothetical protein